MADANDYVTVGEHEALTDACDECDRVTWRGHSQYGKVRLCLEHAVEHRLNIRNAGGRAS